MMKRLLMTLAVVLSAHSAFAQTVATAASKVGWTQAAPDLATAQGYTYAHYDDSATTATRWSSGVVCTGTASPFSCTAPFPAFAPSAHTLTLSTCLLGVGTGPVCTPGLNESAQSASVAFTYSVAPASPTAPKVIP